MKVFIKLIFKLIKFCLIYKIKKFILTKIKLQKLKKFNKLTNF